MAKRTKRGSQAARPAAPQAIKDRLSVLRRLMRREDVDGYLLTYPPDFIYFTGFTGDESAVLITLRGVFIISDGRFTEQLKREAPWAKTYMRKGALNIEIAAACKEQGVERLLVQGRQLSVADHKDLSRRTKGTKLVAEPDLAGEMRVIKTDADVRAMRVAINNAEESFLEMRRSIEPGQTEVEIAAKLEYEMRRRGATAPSFTSIVAEGPNAALPHAHAGKRKVKKGSVILVDWGARVGGYCSDLTRMIFVDSISPKVREVYEIVLDAQLAAISELKPGRRMCDIDAVARKRIDKAGYGEKFNHGLGHGLGLDVHEAPSLSWRSDAELEPGMLVTVEPGIYLPGAFGIRIEDDVLITERGHRVLSKLSKRADDAVI